MGSDVSLQSMVYIPTNTTIGDHVFIGPNAVLTNDRYPPSGIGGLVGPVIEHHAAIGANATILPGIHVGEGALVAGRGDCDPGCTGAQTCSGCTGKDTGSAICSRNKEVPVTTPWTHNFFTIRPANTRYP